MPSDIADLLELARDLGREDRHLAILGEGNTSVRLSPTQFAVKASGARLANLEAADVTVCDTARLVALLDRKTLPDVEVEKALLESRVDPTAKKPSIEAAFHAWLLTLDGVGFVGHCHPLHANQILCSPRVRDFAEHRMFPDEIVCCGASSVYVPYADPGLPLAWQIRERTKDYLRDHGCVPKLIVLQNHGLIALGSTPRAVMACLLMAEKAATIFAGAAAMGGPTFLLPQHIERITNRPDEAYRQGQLGL